MKKILQLNKTIVKNEIESFELNKAVFLDLNRVFLMAFDAYQIMIKYLGFESMPTAQSEDLCHFLSRCRLICKEILLRY